MGFQPCGRPTRNTGGTQKHLSGTRDDFQKCKEYFFSQKFHHKETCCEWPSFFAYQM